MIKFNPEKFTAMIGNEFSRATHVFKSPKDAEAFARDMLDELANRLVTITITVCGQKVVQSGITYDKAMRLKEKFVDAVISEAWEQGSPETEMFSCECGWAGPETGLDLKYPKNWPEKQFITEEYACPECGSFGVEEIEECKPTDEMIENLYVGDFVLVDFRPGKEIVKIDGACSYSRLNGWDFNKNRQPFNQDDILSIRQSAKCWNRRESKPTFDPEPGERVRLKGMSNAVLILGKKTSWNPMKVKYVGYYWLIGGKRSVSFGPDDIVEIV